MSKRIGKRKQKFLEFVRDTDLETKRKIRRAYRARIEFAHQVLAHVAMAPKRKSKHIDMRVSQAPLEQDFYEGQRVKKELSPLIHDRLDRLFNK